MSFEQYEKEKITTGLLFLVNYIFKLQISNLTNRFWSAVDMNVL